MSLSIEQLENLSSKINQTLVPNQVINSYTQQRAQAHNSNIPNLAKTAVEELSSQTQLAQDQIEQLEAIKKENKKLNNQLTAISFIVSEQSDKLKNLEKTNAELQVIVDNLKEEQAHTHRKNLFYYVAIPFITTILATAINIIMSMILSK